MGGWWCLYANIVTGFGPSLGLALWPRAKPIKNEDDFKDEDDPKNEDNLKNEDDLKNEDNHKNEDDLRI